MATVTAVTSGGWTYGGNWDTGSAPTINDDAVIPSTKTMIIDYTASFKTLTLEGGLDVRAADGVCSAGGHILFGVAARIYQLQSLAPVQRKFVGSGGKFYLRMTRAVPDTARYLNFGSIMFSNLLPSISCEGSTTYPATHTLHFCDDAAGDYFLQANPFPSIKQSCSDQNRKGVANSSTKWLNGTPRTWNVIAKFPKVALGGSAPYTYDYAEEIRRMAESPYAVLVSLPFTAFKGKIEAITFAESARHHKATLQIVEG